jgi:hypothetical protein
VGEVEDLRAALEAARKILAALAPLKMSGTPLQLRAYERAWTDAHGVLHGHPREAPVRHGKHSTGWRDEPPAKSGF